MSMLDFLKLINRGNLPPLLYKKKPLKSISILKQYFKVRPVDKNGPVFCHFNGYSVTWYQLYSVLRSVLKFLNMNVNEFNTHSFRIGSSTSEFINVGIIHK